MSNLDYLYKIDLHTEHLPYIATSLTEPTKTANVGLQ